MTILEEMKSVIDEIVFRRYNLKDDLYVVKFIENNETEKYGDVSATVALTLSAQLDNKPLNVAKDIVEDLKNIGYDASFAGPGFINIFLKQDLISSEVKRVSDLKIIETKFTDKKVLVEHSSPNLFKPFHIGHLMNNIVGESIVRMMKATKADLKTMSFPSDISIGIAKAIFILKEDNKRKIPPNLNSFSEIDRAEVVVSYLGEAYVRGLKFYEENPNKQNEILDVAKNLFEKNKETEDWKLFNESREINIKYFENIIEFLGSSFDHLIYESQAGMRGEQIVKENMNLATEEEVFEVGEGGAVVYDTKRKKNNDSDETIKSVFINSEGHPTYEAKDLGLLELKNEYYPFDYNFFVTDNEQVPHFDVVLEVAKKINQDWKNLSEKSFHIPHGRLNMKGVRMSSRLGNVLTVEDTLHTINTKVVERLSDKVKDISADEQNSLIKNISLSALRIAILKSKPGLNIDFDFETSLNFEGATGPYLLYTYARANSILEKGKDFISPNVEIESNNLSKKIIQFESVAKKAIEEIAPQLVVKYLFELTQAFNTFYGKEKIIDENNLEKTKQNLALVQSFAKILKFAMNMIGIKEVEKM